MSFSIKRGLSTTCMRLARTKKLAFTNLNAVKLRTPITPTVSNFDVSPDHPLWQFFPHGASTETALRESEELDMESREWTSAELRLKSFEDLHQLWYIILKERNILAREVRLGQSVNMGDARRWDDLDAKLVKSQKRIKQVLLERHIAFERAQATPEVDEERTQYLDEFKQRYLSGEADEDKFDRLCYAFFGIEPVLNVDTLANDIDVNFVKGVEFQADLKAAKYVQSNPGSELSLPLNGPMEQLPFLLYDVEDAAKQVLDMRSAGVSRELFKIEVIPFLNSAISKHLEGEADNQGLV
ncbi:mitochondrial 54S ribosomal protein uL29m [Lodderomyces beijingensis]|uniref:Large ribosomal subunit protein uL29m n=1 Tax=Lodderomyces beijingensis TaxID=1775926 RepID=A0ABP0ZHL7_9ASCO